MSGIKQRTRQAAAGAVLKAAAKAEGIAGDDSALKDVKQAATAKGGQGFTADTAAQTGASTAVNLVVGLVVGGLMAAFLLPIAIDEIATVDTSGWDNGAAAMWNILPVIIVLAVFLFFVGLALSRSRM
jgi:small-conductance mechanosensitive channel